MNASILLEMVDGTRLDLMIRVVLAQGICPRNDFRRISEAVRLATRSRSQAWRTLDVHLSVVVVAPLPGSEEHKRLLSNAVCEGTGGIIPSGEPHWQTSI